MSLTLDIGQREAALDFSGTSAQTPDNVNAPRR